MSTSLLPTGLWSEITRPSAGEPTGEKGEGWGWMRCGGRDSFSCQSSKSKDTFHNFILWFPLLELYAGVKDVCGRLQEEMVNTLLFQSVCLASLSLYCVTDRQFKRPPAYRYPTAFFSASAIVTKALCKKGHPEFCVLLFYGYHYFFFFFFCLFLFCCFICFHSANDYLNATKQYDENGKKKKKREKNLNIWYLEWRR